jgi:hypothetical protein
VLRAFRTGLASALATAAAAAAAQGLTLVHFSAQRHHSLRDTLGEFSGSVTKNRLRWLRDGRV